MELQLLDEPLAGYLRRYSTVFEAVYNDVLVFFQDLKQPLAILCTNLKQQLHSFKLHLRLTIRFVKAIDVETTCDAFMSNKQTTLLRSSNIDHELTDVFTFIETKVDDFCEGGSGWVVNNIIAADVHISRYEPTVGSSYLPTPAPLVNKKAIINVKNNDLFCFAWAILSALFPATINCDRTTHYQQHLHRINIANYHFPFTLDQMQKFEKEHNLKILIYGFEDGVVFPIYRSKQTNQHMIQLLNWSNADNTVSHYAWIKHFDKLLSKERKHNGRKYFCPHCLFPLYSHERFISHIHGCEVSSYTITMPDESNNDLSFKSIQKCLRQPCIIYADFECLLEPLPTCSPPLHSSYAHKTQLHTPCGYGCVKVTQCCDMSTKTIYPVKIERHPNCVDKFLETVLALSIEYKNSVAEPKPMPKLTGSDWHNFFTTPSCFICKQIFNSTCGNCTSLNRRKWCTDCRNLICRDDCHICQKFRGPVHKQCNISYKLSNDVIVFIHNLKRYDGHLIMQNIGQFAEKHNASLECVAKGIENYIMFALTFSGNQTKRWRIKFLDSYQFLSSSLDKLVANLNKEGQMNNFIVTNHHYPNKKDKELLLRKGVYPYEYMTDWNRFNETMLPSKENFYSSLSGEHINDIYRLCSMQLMYGHGFNYKISVSINDLYLQTDTLLLADVFENFRDFSLKNYMLDPAHYITLPSLGWDACLKMSPVSLELLIDPDMYIFFENSIRGGISMITHRYSKANNSLLNDYKFDEPNSFIISLDANNLYGYSMVHPMPISSFEWMSMDELNNFDIDQIAADSELGYVLEVDLQYPEHLHDKHSDLPLAPEKIQVNENWLSPYCIDLIRKIEHN